MGCSSSRQQIILGEGQPPKFSEVMLLFHGVIFDDKAAGLKRGQTLRMAPTAWMYITDDVRHSIPSMGAFDAPPPPDTNAYMFVLSNQFQQLAKACVLRALDWAGPGAEAAWVRLTEIEADFVSADVLLLMDGRVTLLHEFNNKTTAQQQLLFSIAKDWQALAAGGPVGSHHPGDIVIKGSLSNDNKVAVTVLGAS